MREQIEKALECLIGLSFWGAGRTLNLLSFQFGPRQKRISWRDGRESEVGTYALHVQCAWRIVRGGRILAASDDRFRDWDDEDEVVYHVDGEAYVWSKSSSTLLDQLLSRFFGQCEQTPIFVQTVQVDDLGGVIITLSDGITLTLFPNASADDEEYWRFFRPGKDEPHLVVTAQGIEDPEE